MITENEILELIEKKRQNYIDASLKIWDWAEPIFQVLPISALYRSF